MQPQYIIFVLVLLHIFSANVPQVVGTLSASVMKARRTQSMQALTRTQTGSGSLSTSISSKSSNGGEAVPETQPIASTSNKVRFEEVDIRPIEDELQRTNLLTDTAAEPIPSTHTAGNIDPVRDGVLVNMRSRILPYGAAASVGVAVGYFTGIQISMKEFFGDTSTENYQSIMSKETSYSDVITNPI